MYVIVFLEYSICWILLGVRYISLWITDERISSSFAHLNDIDEHTRSNTSGWASALKAKSKFYRQVKLVYSFGAGKTIAFSQCVSGGDVGGMVFILNLAEKARDRIFRWTGVPALLAASDPTIWEWFIAIHGDIGDVLFLGLPH